MSPLEINPPVVTFEGTLLRLETKIAFNANALCRPAGIAALCDLAEAEKEVEASRYDLNSIARMLGEPERIVIAAADLDDAAQTIVAAVRETR
jgi:succinyl-CoA synthetase beta subunit